MGDKRITVRVEVTYPADDWRTLEELKAATVNGLSLVTESQGANGVWSVVLNAAVDPDPEPTLPDAPPGPEGVRR